VYYATVGLGFDTTTGAGNGPRLYAYNAGTNLWSSRAPTTVAGHPVCNEALAYDPVGDRLYATVVIVQTPAAGGDPTLLTKLAVYNPGADAWVGTTAAAQDSWSPGSEAEYLDGRIYVWRGGFAGGAVNGSDSYLDVYDIAANTWSRTPTLRDWAVVPGFRSGGFDVWGISLSADAAQHRLFVMGAETNRLLYVFDLATQSWAVGPTAPYDGGWGSSIEYVSASDRLYQIDGRDAAGRPQGTAVLTQGAMTQPQPATACTSGSAQFSVVGAGAGPFTYRWQIQTAPGVWASLGNDPLPLPCGGSAHATPPDAPTTSIGVVPCPGVYSYQVRCIVTSPCGDAASNAAAYTVCYANCDCSTAPPVLNVQDFACFLNEFAAADPNANCDGSTAPPVLNVQDFSCFLNAFAAGCS
jgi:hypothetical protein